MRKVVQFWGDEQEAQRVLTAAARPEVKTELRQIGPNRWEVEIEGKYGLVIEARARANNELLAIEAE